MKGPELLLKNLGMTFNDPVRRTRTAKLDSTYRAWIGHDAFYFASHDSREHFLHNPLRYCGTLTDPVTQARFHPTQASPRLKYDGRLYYFASDSTQSRFNTDPKFYARRGPMDEARPMMPEFPVAH